MIVIKYKSDHIILHAIPWPDAETPNHQIVGHAQERVPISLPNK